ncbi:non-ribosomal peptide synthetase [Streptomyces sp. CC77]|uniref:non-ribosomal peptide synthetase n=1 Tax=Streptomyces sp. CC77 TaxID=1906739 RepID=UPI0008DD256E|nr:non-ribosomal peptide synthetase [Streptomyces sp. CC77]OII66465.1 AMP-dependent synthetase [Streptomyces sp. CC77]
MPLSELLPDVRAAVPFARRLAAFGERPALITDGGGLTYRELADRVARTAERLGPHRRLVLLAGANTADALVVHLAALSAGHPVLLVPGDRPEAVHALTAAYDPDVVAAPGPDGTWTLAERRPASAHSLHPELALLLSTSGSTGSPKLVRLSHGNVQSNAEAIAHYLGIRPEDRAATTLPMHYCYGLSVVHSHLARGAALVLTDLSVADPCFWDLFRTTRATAFAGVPYTFDLLDRVGFADMDLPHLRYVTQAGGRLAPERVSRYAELGRRRGWDLFVMYGQTEATARMAYLPPDRAAAHPDAVGVPVPGGSFHLRPHPDWPEPGTGELVYRGPNVMLGYAETPADLALGRTVSELPTGDIGRVVDEDGDGPPLYAVVGRVSRFAKILGVRVDPHRVEETLAGHGVTALATGADDALTVAAAGDADPDAVRRLVTAAHGLPPRAVHVHVLPELPRLTNGKPDYRAVRALRPPGDAGAPPETSADGPAPGGRADLRALYAVILDRPDATEDDSFVDLGGDSLSYVEMSLRLEEALGHLPADWHVRPIRDLRARAGRKAPATTERSGGAAAKAHGLRLRRPAVRRIETGVALRALAIVVIVGSHIPVFHIKGGAHLLLTVAGYNLARFHLTPAARRDRVRRVLRSAARVAVPSVLWIACAWLLTEDYRAAAVFLVESFLPPREGPLAAFWFVDTLVFLLLAATAVLAVPAVDRLERRHPFGLPAALTALALVTRYDLFGLREHAYLPTPLAVPWLFALGWAAAKATRVGQRLLVTAAALATVPGLFPGEPAREALIVAGFALLVWVPTLPSLASLNRVAGVLAGSSLYIYLTHWQVFPRVDHLSGWFALAASLVAGGAYARLAARVGRAAKDRIRPPRPRSRPARPGPRP